ncbi:IS1 family transposase [Alloacidobacterium dinghuense]|uniref:IS1 family transposase n=1 Tax=Alloacidobacterium dinghuense TaxID=2763107 RepID=A0A7G8BK25_9BACT|nr:IS1 family transposase [Alloacidobacterium dinghuense]QNI32895.1 IS1 family transposase [Alloacidobacterium dinghuense]
MNRLSTAKRVQVVSALVEGNSINAIVRMTGVAKHTVLNLLRDLGIACAEYHDQNVRGLRVKRLQCDEIWSFVGAKKKAASPEQKQEGWGDAWTWTGIDADTKLCVSYLVGLRDKGCTFEFIQDCADRIVGRPQITTDALKAYPDAIEAAFGSEVDYAQLHKIYGAPDKEEARRYSPSAIIGTDMKTVCGNPDPKHVSTSFVERQNLTMRMHMRRFTRLTNGFSKKQENHAHAVALHFMYYNFCKVHKTLRVTPAMQAGLTDHIWTLEELCALIPKKVAAKSTIDQDLIRRALESVEK